MFALGILALLQIIALPGWLWIRLARLPARNFCESAVYAFCASLMVNHVLVCLLTLTRLHNRWVWLAIILGELAALLWLRDPVSGSAGSEGREEMPTPSEPFSYSPLLAAMVAVSFLAVGSILWVNWGTVFVSNDDVASWDRFAEDWYLNRWPVGSHLYPQMIPSNWSISYALIGRPEVKMFAKAIMPLFPLCLLLLFVSLAQIRRDQAFLGGCVLCGFLFLQYLGRDFLMTGYVDCALALFCFLPFYVIQSEHPGPVTRATLATAIFFASGAALTKQGGLLALGAVLLYSFWSMRKSEGSPRVPVFLRWSAWLSPVFVLTWYLWKNFSDPSWNRAMRTILGDVHQGRGYWERLIYGCTLFVDAGDLLGPYLLGLLAMLLVGGLMLSETRRVTAGIVVPLFLVWAIGFSYEIRTAAPLLPLVAYVGGIVLARAGARVAARLSRPSTGILLVILGVILSMGTAWAPRIQSSYGWPLVVAGVGMAAASVVQLRIRLAKRGTPVLITSLVAGTILLGWPRYPDDLLLAEQLAAQRKVGRPAVNDRLYQLRAQGQLNRPVLSNYWYLGALPDLRTLNRYLSCGRCTIDELLSEVTRDKTVGFMLVDDAALSSGTARLMDHCAGLENVFTDGAIRLIRVDQAHIETTCKVDPEAIRPVIEKLYPAETMVGARFNIQPNGSAAIAIACRNASAQSVIRWAGRELRTGYGGDKALSAEVPGDLFGTRGSFPIEIWDKGTDLRSAPVQFEVK